MNVKSKCQHVNCHISPLYIYLTNCYWVKSTHKNHYPHRFELKLILTPFCLDINEFQHSAMYGCRVRTRRKIDCLENFSLPAVIKSTIILKDIKFNDLQFTSLVYSS